MKFSKRILSIFLALLIFISVNLTSVSAVTSVSADTGATYTSGDYQYKILDDGTIEITEYFGNDIDLVIPSTIDGYVVSIIGMSAFEQIKATSLTIPSSVVRIKRFAFFCANNIKILKLSNGLERIDDSAFANCLGLKELIIPSSVRIIDEGAFNWCTGLESVTIPYGVEEIGVQAFWYCENLESVTIPGSVKILGANAFADCIKLIDVTIENGVESIEGSAFSNCLLLSSVSLPDSLISIKGSAFLNCYSLTNIVIPANITEIKGNSIGWYHIEGKGYKYTDFKIYGYSGTAGEEYAVENEFEFIPLDKGDADESTSLDIKDVTCMQKIIAKINPTNDFKTANCDLNGDGKLTIKDATILQLYLANKIDKFPVQE